MDENQAGGRSLLLHVCCGPCTIAPLGVLRENGYSVEAYFFNPNIQPYREYRRRAETMEQLAAAKGLPVSFALVYELEEWLEAAVPAHAQGERCRVCYRLRLGETAAGAARGGFSAFTTTLLGSPYQNREWLLQEGAAAGERHGVEFIGSDFRPHFRKGQGEARDMDLYRQGYCGCVYSEKERYYKG